MKKQLFILLSVVVSLIFACTAGAKSKGYPEKWYQEKWCAANKGKLEVVMPDGSRCDCVTDTHAIEFDFAKKWSEAIGQSLNYSMQTSKRAGIVLIVNTPKDRRFWIRLNSIIRHFNVPIDTWMMTTKGERENE